MTIWYGSILVIDEMNIGHYPMGVKAQTKAEALGKLIIVASRLFTGKRFDVRVNDGVDPVIDDPEKVSLGPDVSKS